MELLKSKKFEIPVIYYITDREEIKDLPIGIPFIYGKEKEKEAIIRLLEYEVLYRAALKTGYPFDFKKILKENGYDDIRSYSFTDCPYMEYNTDPEALITERYTMKPLNSKAGYNLFSNFIKDGSVYVDIQALKNLKAFPIWMEDLEDSLTENINTFATFNPYLYNKKLDGIYGDITLTPPPKNLVIIDISSSIPRAASATSLALARNFSESYYADLLITGSDSVLYPYEEVHKLDVTTIYETIGMNNECFDFRNLLFNTERKYGTAIVFGDNHDPSYGWQGEANLSIKDGKKLNKWNIKKVISLHTRSNTLLAGYARFFEPKEIKHIKDWIKFLK